MNKMQASAPLWGITGEAAGEGHLGALDLLETFYFPSSESWKFILLLCCIIYTFVE